MEDAAKFDQQRQRDNQVMRLVANDLQERTGCGMRTSGGSDENIRVANDSLERSGS